MKIYLNQSKENWIIERLRREWYQYNSTISTKLKSRADILWIISPWTYSKKKLIKSTNNKTVLSVYHIDEEKFGKKEQQYFEFRDEFVDVYHVISENTKLQLGELTNKPVFSIPFWINEKIFFNIEDKKNIRQEFNFHEDDFIVGSFQRDSEGTDLSLPKLSKGPDRFLEIVTNLRNANPNLKVLLTGKRRDYLISQLIKNKIPYYYFEMVDFQSLNKLYNSLDLYIVASRYEGGPQAIMECAITKTSIISTNVGVAPEILSNSSIFNMSNFSEATPNDTFAYEAVQDYKIPQGFNSFIKFFKEVYEN